MSVGQSGSTARAAFTSAKPFDKAVLVSTTDTGFTGNRKWADAEAKLADTGNDQWQTSAEIPAGTTAWFMNAYSGGLVVSSDYQDVAEPRPAVKPEPEDISPDTFWAYKRLRKKQLRMHVFLPHGYEAGDRFPVYVAFHEGLKNAGNDSECYVGKGGGHGFSTGGNGMNPFFYWRLELEDRFLVKHAILTGASLVEVPEGVRRLTEADSDACE